MSFVHKVYLLISILLIFLVFATINFPKAIVKTREENNEK